ncbi:MAG: hypothetical protein AAF481_03630 [Acidobacteriota bacterium]
MFEAPFLDKPSGREVARLRWALPIASLFVLAAFGCASSPVVPPSTTAPVAEPPVAGPAASTGLPTEWLSSQYLFRVRYDGGEGAGSFRLVLRLTADDRFQASAVDLFGRPLWALQVSGGEGLWLDRRESFACRAAASFELPLAPLPIGALPALLLGRLPVPLAMDSAGEAFDASGRRWTYSIGGGGSAAAGTDKLTAWTVWRGRERLLAWLIAGEERVLSDPRGGYQLRWRRVNQAPLAAPPSPLTIPPDYREVECKALLGDLSPI